MKTLVIGPHHHRLFVAVVTLAFLPCTALPRAPTPKLAEPPKAVEPANPTPPNQIGSTDIEAQVYGPGAGRTAAPFYNGKPGTEAGQQCVNPQDRAVMMWIPAGEFLMGRKDGHEDSDERPQRTVYLNGRRQRGVRMAAFIHGEMSGMRQNA